MLEVQDLLWATAHPSHTPQAPSSPSVGLQSHFWGGKAAAEPGVNWWSIGPGCQACCPSAPSAQHCEQQRALTLSTRSKDTSFNIRNHSHGFVSLKDASIVFFSISVHPHPELFIMQDITTPISPGFLQSDFHSFCLDCSLAGLLLTSTWRCTFTMFVSFAQAQHLQTGFCSQVGECSICSQYSKIQAVLKAFSKLYLNVLKSQESENSCVDIF